VAITYLRRGWQRAGLTRVNYEMMNIERKYFERAFHEAASKAEYIFFNVTNLDPAKGNQALGFTWFEFFTSIEKYGDKLILINLNRK
jgi:hypothetical protein